MKLSLLIPTRKRPHYMDRVFASAMDLADNPNNVEFIFYIDNDDQESEAKVLTFKNTDYVVGERIILSQMWNECYKIANGEIFWHGNDDVAFRTKGWDTLIVNTFNNYPDKIVFVGGKNGWEAHNNVIFTHGWLHDNWVKTLGYFCPPYFSSDYNDTWLTDVAKKINRFHYLPELLIEHFHPAFGTAPEDEVHKDRIKRHYQDNVAQLYDNLHNERIKDAEKLSQFILNYSPSTRDDS